MNGRRTRSIARWGVALVLGVVMTASWAPAALAATPTQPKLRTPFVWVSDVGEITVQWDASTDASGHAIAYQVYRDVKPITSATIGVSPTLELVVDDYTGTAYTGSANATEIAQSYVWYYAVRVKATVSPGVFEYSLPSKSASPNMHGFPADSKNTVSCERCHNVHGATGDVDYRETGLCYTCHAGADSSSPGARSSINTKADFFEYGDQTPGSQHIMGDDSTRCAACHTPHRSPWYYDASGTYVATNSFRNMLRIQTGIGATGKPTYTYTSRNDDTAENTSSCMLCHGSSSTNIAYVGDASSYADTAGDHNSAGYATAAHGPSVILSNDTVSSKPQVQCLACHDNHASAADKLIDYRKSGTADADLYGGAGICFACHSNSSTETKVTGSAKPFAWNSRDVQAQFAKTSHHPYTVAEGTWEERASLDLSHTTQAQFNTYTLTQAQTTASDDGEIVLGQYETTVDPPAETVVYGQQGGSSSFDMYNIGSQTWNDPINPANNNLSWNPGSGSSAFWVNDRFYMTRGGSSSSQGSYNPATNTWSTATSTYGGIGTAGDTAVNSSAGYVYYTPGEDYTSRIYWWQYSGSSTGYMTHNMSGGLGRGSAIAYAPGAGTGGRLFAIYENDSSGDGHLWYLASPGGKTGSQSFTDTNVSVAAVSYGYYHRMTYFSVDGTEYLAVLGRDSSNNNNLLVVSNLAGTPAVTSIGKYPFSNTLTDGCDLEWNGGSYLYAIDGSTSSPFARIRIPDAATTPSSWPDWESMPNPSWGTSWGTGASIAVGTYDPPAQAGLAYYSSGSAVSTEITPNPSSHHWGEVDWTEDEPAGTSLKVTVEGYNGSWSTLVSQSDSAPVNMSAYSTSTYTKLRLTVHLTSTDTLATPSLLDLSTTSLYDQWVTADGRVACVSCHNVHAVGKGNTSPWNMARVSDPDNTKLAYSGSATDYCLRCHDSSAPVQTVNATTLVPYSVGFSEITSPLFPGWDKTTSGADFVTGAHRSTTISKIAGQIGCETCHDPHASDNKRLVAVTVVPGGSASQNHLNERRNNSTTYAEENLCYGCHDSRRMGVCSSAGCHQVSLSNLNARTAFTATYRHPVEVSGRHTDTETANQLGASNRHAECADCHDPHGAGKGLHTTGSSKPGAVLRGATGVKPANAWPANWGVVSGSGWSAERMTGENTDFEAYVCFKCHSSYSGQPFSVTSGSGTYTSTDVSREFNPSNFSYHNVLGQSVGMQTSFTVKPSGGSTQTVTWALPATVDVFTASSGYNRNSMLTCTSCHINSSTTTSQAKGPHGSSVKWLIDSAYPTEWKTTYLNSTTNGMSNTTNICAKCHDLNGASSSSNWSNDAHEDRHHCGEPVDGQCNMCHIAIPHGWKRPRLLGYTTDGVYATNTTYGMTGLRVRSHTLGSNGVSWDDTDCAAKCGEHDTSFSTTILWP